MITIPIPNAQTERGNVGPAASSLWNPRTIWSFNAFNGPSSPSLPVAAGAPARNGGGGTLSWFYRLIPPAAPPQTRSSANLRALPPPPPDSPRQRRPPRPRPPRPPLPPPPPHPPHHFMDTHKIKENLVKVNIFFEVSLYWVAKKKSALIIFFLRTHLLNEFS